tara:strand:+ start:2424 stop:2552 length:129 start_codon:yes stop_codon:yes gene_type:complete
MTRKDWQIADVLYDNNQKGIFTINDLTSDFIDAFNKESFILE